MGYSKQSIEWTSANIDNIKIEYSLDSAKTWTTIINSYPASAQIFEWEVPNKTSDSCFIKISDLDNNTIVSTNYPGNPFKIPPPGIELDVFPVSIMRGTILPISWSSSGIKKINLYVSFNNKNTFIKIADTVDARQNYYNWQVPDTLFNNCYIKIQDVTNTDLVDTSNAAFSIITMPAVSNSKYKGGVFDGFSSAANQLKKLTLQSLINGDSLYGGIHQSIKWTILNIERIHIYYSTDNGNSWLRIAENVPATAQLFDWNVSSTPTNTGKIKLVDAADQSVFSINNNPFVIKPKELQLLLPNKVSTAYRSTVFPISWKSGGIKDVQLKLLINNQNIILKDSISADNEIFNWITPATSADTIKIIICDVSDSTLADTTSNILIKQMLIGSNLKYKGGSYDGHSAGSNIKGRIRLTVLNNREEIPVANTFKIKWTSDQVENIQLQLSIDSGNTWTVIASNTNASSGYYIWNPANTPSNYCLLKIIDLYDSTIFDVSDAIFTILPKSIVNITDSINWIKGTIKTIEWLSNGVDSVGIYYKTSINNDWKSINQSYPGQSEAINWILPDSIEDSIWIKIQDIKEQSVFSVKGFYHHFTNLKTKILPIKYRGGSFDGHTQRSNITKILIKHPAANEIIVGGSKYTITWTNINIEDSILIQYTTDSGRTWVTIARTVAASGIYDWLVPNSIKNQSVQDIHNGKIQSNSIQSIISKIMQTASSALSSKKCMIRILDITAGYRLVGASIAPFTIVVSNALLNDELHFPQPDNLEINQPAISLQAYATSKRPVKYFIQSGTEKAELLGAQILAKSSGKITIGAFIEEDSIYEGVDTIYQTICVNPEKPNLNYSGKGVICAGDSIYIKGPSWTGSYSWSTGDSTNYVILRKATKLSLKISIEGCYSNNSDTIIFSENNFKASITNVIKTASICIGDSVILTSNAVFGNQWLHNEKIINGAVDTYFSAKLPGKYQLQVNNNGCNSKADSSFELVNYAQIEKPTITLSNGSLLSSSKIGNQWYNISSGIIDGATSSIYRPKSSGFYQSRVIVGGCASPFSDPFYYLVTGLEDINNNSTNYIIAPNPVQNTLYINVGTNQNKFNLKLFDLNGIILIDKNFKQKTFLNLSLLSAGTYSIALTDLQTKQQKTQQIIKQ